MSVISLISDFGLNNPYVGQMKAVILSINSNLHIVDISHGIEKFNVQMGAYVLASTAPHFPPKTVHVAVVDPGVGTKRRPIIVKTKKGYYVGPDNGLLMLAAHKDKILKVYEIKNPKYLASEISKTFHGRDIFAPTAAHLATGVEALRIGIEIDDYMFPKFAKVLVEKGKLFGEILYVDDFGNVISNISKEELEMNGFFQGSSIKLNLSNKQIILNFFLTYGDVAIGSPLLLIGSSDLLEIALNQGNASEFFRIKVGDTVCISKVHT
jgi:S-adenosylmethionine hydrolase